MKGLFEKAEKKIKPVPKLITVGNKAQAEVKLQQTVRLLSKANESVICNHIQKIINNLRNGEMRISRKMTEEVTAKIKNLAYKEKKAMKKEKPHKQIKELVECPICGEATVSDKFCSHCGEALHKVKCPECKTVNIEGYPFCRKCGRELEEPAFEF